MNTQEEKQEKKEKRAELSGRLSYVLATFFLVGLIPFAPGTFGSAAGLIAYLLLNIVFCSKAILLVITVLLFFFGVYVSDSVSSDSSSKDPSYIVIDEVVGIFIAMLFINELSVFSCCIAFVFFRLFDIVKPYPVNKCESLPGGWGIMLDDVAAGLFAGGLAWVFFILF